ncbi:MAG: hypothetical protein ACOH1X_03705 [Kaistella sp.]
MKALFKIFFTFLTVSFFQSQVLTVDDFLWDQNQKLSVQDFQIKTQDTVNPIKSTLIISWELKGFSVLNKNFNQNVVNKIVRSASVVNENMPNVTQLIDYQQTNFDLAEIYARKMRKDLFLNKSKLWKGFDYASEILKEHLSEFYRVQLLMEIQSNSGNDEEKLNYWKDLIKTELLKTQQYDYQNRAKIVPEKDATSNAVL